MILKKARLDFITYALLLWLTFFIGNAKINNVPLILILPIVFLLFQSIIIRIKDLIMILALSLAFSIYALNLDVYYNIFYSTWVISFFLGFLITGFIFLKLTRHPTEMLYGVGVAFSVILIFLALGIIIFGKYSDGRVSFIFGPNMLYRVVIFLSIFSSGFLLINKHKYKALFFIMIAIYLSLLTGSRGAGVSIAFLLLSSWHFYQGKFRFTKLFFAVLLLLISLVFFVDLEDSILGRVINFSSIDTSTVDYKYSYQRLKPIVYFFYEEDFLSIIGITHQRFMELFGSADHRYPHNIFLELVIFYGLFGIGVAMYIMLKIIVILQKLLTSRATPMHVYYYSIIGGMIGSLLSGDMGDNGVFIGAVFALKHNLKLDGW